MISRTRISILAVLAFAGLCGLQAAQNVATVNGVAIANVGTVNGVAIANVGTIQGVDNTSAGGSVTTAGSDAFTRSDRALDGSWTVANGSLEIASNEAKITTNSALCAAIHTSTTANANQWVRVRVRVGSGYYGIFPFRYTNSSSAYYQVVTDNASNLIRWDRVSAIGGSETTLESQAFAVPDATTFTLCFTVTGTGTGTEVRVWINPTGDAATPTSASDWGGDSTPDASFTANPGSPVDTGSLAGMGGYSSSANQIYLDDWSFGALP
jgi:Tfp pilus assembly protein PilW